MYEYTEKAKLDINVPLHECICDMNKICKDMGAFDYDIGDSKYYFHMYISTFVKRFLICIEIYDDDMNEICYNDMQLSQNINFKQELGVAINKFVDYINGNNIKARIFKKSKYCYEQDGRLFLEAYNFNTGEFKETPEYEVITIQVEFNELDDLYNRIIKK